MQSIVCVVTVACGIGMNLEIRAFYPDASEQSIWIFFALTIVLEFGGL